MSVTVAHEHFTISNTSFLIYGQFCQTSRKNQRKRLHLQDSYIQFDSFNIQASASNSAVSIKTEKASFRVEIVVNVKVHKMWLVNVKSGMTQNNICVYWLVYADDEGTQQTEHNRLYVYVNVHVRTYIYIHIHIYIYMYVL